MSIVNCHVPKLPSSTFLKTSNLPERAAVTKELKKDLENIFGLTKKNRLVNFIYFPLLHQNHQIEQWSRLENPKKKLYKRQKQ
jgi:hypothetical protein